MAKKAIKMTIEKMTRSEVLFLIGILLIVTDFITTLIYYHPLEILLGIFGVLLIIFREKMH